MGKISSTKKWLLSIVLIFALVALVIFLYPKPVLPIISLIPIPMSPAFNKIVDSIQGTIFGNGIKSELPIRLVIPGIKVDAHIEYVGLTSDGSMEVPEGPFNVAWFDLGPRPGDVGSAVIAGHYGPWKSGASSVFDDLNTLKTGDEILVIDARGATTTFAVREIRTFDPKAEASTVFGSNNEGIHLNLVTCEGVWDGTKKTYSNRLVVFTDKVVE